jgi:hypothetical protein
MGHPSVARGSVRTFVGASPRRFRPSYALANLGHPSNSLGIGLWSERGDRPITWGFVCGADVGPSDFVGIGLCLYSGNGWIVQDL